MIITDLEGGNAHEVKSVREFNEWLATCACIDCLFIPDIKYFGWFFVPVVYEETDIKPIPDYKGPGIYHLDGSYINVELDGFCPQLNVYFEGYHDFINDCRRQEAELKKEGSLLSEVSKLSSAKKDGRIRILEENPEAREKFLAFVQRNS